LVYTPRVEKAGTLSPGASEGMRRNQRMSYRGKLIFGFAMVAALAALVPIASAQLVSGPLKVANIRDNVYWAEGGAGVNTGFIVGTTGVIVVDAKTTEDSQNEVLAEIAKVSAKPVDTVIITHSDHIKGIAAFPSSVTIIAQENCKKEMETSHARDAAPADRRPTKTVANDETMTIDGVHLRLLHWAPAHTSGDLVVYLPDQKIVFAEDLLVTDRPPDDTPVHAALHGSAAGWFENVKGMLALDADTYVLGHGESLFTKDDARKKMALIQGKWDKVQAMVMQGKSLSEVKAAFGEATVPTPNAQGNLPEPSLTEIMYNEMTKDTHSSKNTKTGPPRE
jgi:glyoxylase-like metal-dependent hydrolase (beta-lactamase superfamily II)